MNRLTLFRAFRKLQARTVCCLALFVAFPFTGRARNATASKDTKPPASLQALAQDLTQQLASQKNLKVVVLDFAAPDKRSIPFGAYLADQFAAELSKVSGGSLTVVDRAKLPAALTSLNLEPDAELQHDNYRNLEIAVDAQCVIVASYGELKGGLGITMSADCPDALHVPHTPINRRIDFAPEMAARLGAPLESLRLSDGAQDSGTAGLTYPWCTQCPAASYSNKAVTEKISGTVTLTAVVTPEGRATDIQVIKGLGYGLDEKASAAISKWKFKPAADPDGTPTPVRQTIQVTFQLYQR
jgi:TonB family protein